MTDEPKPLSAEEVKDIFDRLKKYDYDISVFPNEARDLLATIDDRDRQVRQLKADLKAAVSVLRAAQKELESTGSQDNGVVYQVYKVLEVLNSRRTDG